VRRLKSFALAAVAALTFGYEAVAQEFPSLKLRYNIHVPENNVVSESDKFFAEEVRKRTNGRVNIELYWNRAIARQQEVLPLLSAGAIDLSTLETAQYGETPLMGFMNTIFPIHQDARKLIGMSKWLYENSTGIKGELQRIGAQPLYVRHLPNYYLLCRKPFRTIEEFKGAKLRSFGAYVPVMWRALGANAVNVVTTEMYDGLSKGTFDCTFLPSPFLHSLKLYEVGKYLIDVPLGMIEFAPTLMSSTVWNKLPENVRKVLTEAAAETEQFALKKTEAEGDEAIKLLVAAGVERVAFPQKDELIKMLPDLMGAWLDRQKAEGRGPAAEQIVTYARQQLGVPAR
jgi:TRAP-type transport system periplasmic protein